MKKFVSSFKKPVMFVLVVLLILTLSPVVASAKTESNAGSDVPVTYERTITVTEHGGNFKVGFATVRFPKNCLDEEDLPLVVDVEIYAENGKVYIEFSPDVNEFNKPVLIRARKYKGCVYDRATGENIYVELPKQWMQVTHFSRYCFVF